MSDARRKQQKRLKREQKRALLRKQQNASPYKRLADNTQVEACYVNSNWREMGMASITVIRRSTAGALTLGRFLVDIWCAGLKDAHTRIDLGREDIDHAFRVMQEQFELERIDIDTARRFVAAGIRFARQNGFKLPAHLDRWLHVLGGLPEIETADLSNFGDNGKLRWVGPLDDLQQRLIGTTPEAFLARPDVEFVAGVDGDFDEFESLDDEEDADAFGTALGLVGAIEPVFVAIQTNLRTRGLTPHPRLLEGLKLVIARTLYDKIGQTPVAQLDEHGLAMRLAMNTLVSDVGNQWDHRKLPADLYAAARQARDELELLCEGKGLIESIGSLLNPANSLLP